MPIKSSITSLLLASAVALATLAGPALAEFTPATGTVSIVDGDTISVGRERIRLLDIDTPETFRSRCENELVLGLKAKERLRQLLDSGPVSIERDGRDRYRRTLAQVRVGDIDVGATLLAEGFALPYQQGGSQACAPADLVRSERGALRASMRTLSGRRGGRHRHPRLEVERILAELRQQTRNGEGSALDEPERLEDRWAGVALPHKLDDDADMADGINDAANRGKAEEGNGNDPDELPASTRL